MVTHPATDPVRPGLTWSLVVKGNALTAYATREETRIRSEKLRGPKGLMFKQKALAKVPMEGPVMSAQAEWTTLKIALVEAAEEVCGRVKYGKNP